MKYELKKIDLWSVLKISLLVHAVLGIIFGGFSGVFFSALFTFMESINSYSGPDFSPAAFGVFGGLMIGVYYALVIIIINGFIVPLIFVFLYNLMVKWVGGIKLHFENVVEVKPESQPSTYNSNSTGGTT